MTSDVAPTPSDRGLPTRSRPLRDGGTRDYQTSTGRPDPRRDQAGKASR